MSATDKMIEELRESVTNCRDPRPKHLAPEFWPELANEIERAADTISVLKEENRLLSVENGLLLSNAAAKGEEPDLLLAEWHNEHRRADRAEEAFAICVAQIGALREALEPFAAFAENVDEEGWMSNIHRGSISTWFGPSDFRRAARALSDTGETG